MTCPRLSPCSCLDPAGDDARGTAASQCPTGAGDGCRCPGKHGSHPGDSQLTLSSAAWGCSSSALGMCNQLWHCPPVPWGRSVPVPCRAGATVVDDPTCLGSGRERLDAHSDPALLRPWCQAEAQGSKRANKLGSGGGGAQDKACRHRRFQGLKYSSGLMRRPPSCRP